MKKISVFLISALLLLSMVTTAFATSNGDDLSELTDEIITITNDLFSNELSREITVDDINYNDAFKIYVGTNIFETNITSVDEIPAVFGDDGYIYELPIYVGDDTIIINIAKGQPLNENVEMTESETKNILDSVGNWQATAIKHYNNEIVDYSNELQAKTGAITENSVLVGGLPHFVYAVALLPDEQGNIENLVPLSDVPGVENIRSFSTISENAYDYNEIKEYINELPPIPEGQAGAYGFLDTSSSENTNDTYIVLIGTTILLFGVGTTIIINKKYHKER